MIYFVCLNQVDVGIKFWFSSPQYDDLILVTSHDLLDIGVAKFYSRRPDSLPGRLIQTVVEGFVFEEFEVEIFSEPFNFQNEIKIKRNSFKLKLSYNYTLE